MLADERLRATYGLHRCSSRPPLKAGDVFGVPCRIELKLGLLQHVGSSWACGTLNALLRMPRRCRGDAMVTRVSIDRIGRDFGPWACASVSDAMNTTDSGRSP